MKKIEITGKKNIKKITANKNIKMSKRIDVSNNNNNNDNGKIILDNKKQLEMISKLYMDISFDNIKELKSNIQKKWNGYKQQDKKNYMYNEDSIISYNDIISKLLESKLKCYYCKCSLQVYYKESRLSSQWTLDRIDNTLAHTNTNTLICCLDCNLKRRNMNKDKFLFTKSLSIEKKV